MKKEINDKIAQLQYEISLLGLDKEELTGVTIRTDELKDLVNKDTVNTPDEVYGSSYCKYSVIENKLKTIGDNQMKLFKEIQSLKNH